MEKAITKKDIADLLRDKRAESGLKGAEVVQRLKLQYGINLSYKTLYGYENEVSSPNVPLFLALCKIYGVEDIIGEIERSKRLMFALEKDEKTLVDFYRESSEEARALALKMLEPVEKGSTASLVG